MRRRAAEEARQLLEIACGNRATAENLAKEVRLEAVAAHKVTD
jgi:hypothetical protein